MAEMNNSNTGCLAAVFALFTYKRLGDIEANTRRTNELLEGALYPQSEDQVEVAPPIASRERDKRWEEQLKRAAAEEEQVRVEQARAEMAEDAAAANADLPETDIDSEEDA